jgi:hypothetical protein
MQANARQRDLVPLCASADHQNNASGIMMPKVGPWTHKSGGGCGLEGLIQAQTSPAAAPKARLASREAFYANLFSSRSTASAECPTFLTASESRSFDTLNLSAQY